MTLIIVLVSFLALIILHELGHYLFAKKYGVKVEEFGIGLPPRLIGKKIGETLYSLNLLPIGAFVRLQGEEQAAGGPRSFTAKPIWQRMVIVAAGVVAFWLVAALIFTGLAVTSGIPTGIGDEEVQGVVNPKVQILGVAKDSPAENAGIELGDSILKMEERDSGVVIEPTKVKEVQSFTDSSEGKEIILTLQRGEETREVALVPRTEPPAREGAMGVALVRTAFVKYAWYEAPFRAIERTAVLTYEIVRNLGGLLVNLVSGKGVPAGVEFMGPVGIVDFLNKSLSLGIAHFLSFFAVLAVYLAIFNALPIPVVDGGKLLFLGIEAIRKKPVSELWEKRVSAVVFALLITLMIWVTVKDITRIF
ncbi:site-2 protease family protein [Patescibacteria group bacterium]|nr:site-2 protease family protein [Patescibacteria group bacterium]